MIPNRRKIGADWEKKAGEYLKAQGYRILRYNFRCRIGEIDLVARDGPVLVFVEVKYRRTSQAGDALEAVSPAKQRMICRMADIYLSMNSLMLDTPCRFDVVAIMGDEIRLVKNAFMHPQTF